MELDHWEEELLEVAERKLERGEITRREFVRLLGVLGIAAAVPGALAGRAQAVEAAQAGSVRFLIAENFWANWEPYQNTAQSQFRINEQIYDHLVEFPTGDRSNRSARSSRPCNTHTSSRRPTSRAPRRRSRRNRTAPARSSSSRTSRRRRR